MPFQAGVPRPPNAGRKKGSLNRPKYVERVCLSVDVRPVTLSTYPSVDLLPTTEPTEEETPTESTEEISTSIDTFDADPSPIVASDNLTTTEDLSPPQPIEESPTTQHTPRNQRRKTAPTLAQAQPPIEDAIVVPPNLSPEMLVRETLSVWWRVLHDPKSQIQNQIKVTEIISRVLISRQPAPLHDLDIDLKLTELELKRIELNNKKQQTMEGEDSISFGFLPSN